jgi:Iron-sulfur cluster assembly accessory protein
MGFEGKLAQSAIRFSLDKDNTESKQFIIGYKIFRDESRVGKMAITLTENAAKQISKQLEKRGSGIGLKLGVKVSGCSGFAYVLAYADKQAETDIVFEQFGVKVLVSADDLDKLEGVELDYLREGINEAFKFNNPNVTGECGCGESFSV